MIPSYRFTDMFPDAAKVRVAQRELDEIIQQGVFQITRLLKNTEASQQAGDSEQTYHMRRSTFTKGKPTFPYLQSKVSINIFS